MTIIYFHRAEILEPTKLGIKLNCSGLLNYVSTTKTLWNPFLHWLVNSGCHAHYICYLKTTAFLHSQLHDLSRLFISMFFDKKISESKHATKAICHALNHLFTPNKTQQHLNYWLKDFPTEDLPQKLIYGYQKLPKVAITESWRETQFWITHRAYILCRIYRWKLILDQASYSKCKTLRPSLTQKLWHAISILGASVGLCD